MDRSSSHFSGPNDDEHAASIASIAPWRVQSVQALGTEELRLPDTVMRQSVQAPVRMALQVPDPWHENLS